MNTHRGRRRLLALALILIPAVRAEAATTTVIERGVQFVPAQVDVSVGDTVTWVYESSPSNSGHTVTFDDPTLNDTRFQSCPALLVDDCQRNSSDRISRTFRRVGTFPYSCKLHRSQGMAGVVVVNAASTPGTTNPSGPTTTSKATTTTTAKATSSTTSTTRVLATSSTVIKSTTTTSDTTNVLLPGDPPPFSGDDPNSSATGQSGGSNDDGSDSTTVAVIVGLLLAVSAGGAFLLWRLRPGRA